MFKVVLTLLGIITLLRFFQLGAKKGLGAQKVSSQSFTEVERQAQVAEKLREQQAADYRKEAEESM